MQGVRKKPLGLSLETTQTLPVFSTFKHEGELFRVNKRVINCYFCELLVTDEKPQVKLDMKLVVWLTYIF